MQGLFNSIVAPAQLEAMVSLAESAPPGDFAEVGVFHGGSAARLYQVCLRQGRKLHLFDTFSGTPVHTPGLDHHKVDAEFADTEAPDRIRALMPDAQVYVGVYPQTHPSSLRDVAFVHCDCDQYASYRAVIDHMWPIMAPGGFLLFDDYPYLAGAKKAVEETFDIRHLRRCTQRFYVVKPSGV